MVKRASSKLDPKTLAYAKALRKRGMTMREVVKALRDEGMTAARSTLGEYFAKDPDLQAIDVQAAVDAAEEAESDALTGDIEEAADETVKVYRSLLRDVARRVKGDKKTIKSLRPSHIEALSRGLDRLLKIVELRRGRPTERREVNRGAAPPAAPAPTETEQRAMRIIEELGGLSA